MRSSTGHALIALISLANPALLPASVERDTPQVGGEPIRGLRQRRKRANAELALKDLTDGGWFGINESEGGKCSGCKPGQVRCAPSLDGYCGEDYECCNDSCGTCAKPGDSCSDEVCVSQPGMKCSGCNAEMTGCYAHNDGYCEQGMECCNDSCGICVEPGTLCHQRVCQSQPQLVDQILCGYQGWFSFPGDGAPINRWKHWFKQTSASDPKNPTLEELSVDSYPTTDEYDPADLVEVRGLTMPDGSAAKFFSSVKYGVVLRHFTWMKEYGISGVFHLRFMESIHIDRNREWKTMVLRNVRQAAQATGRSFAVSYNISGRTLTNKVLQDMKIDWKRLVDEEKITQSRRYIRHSGRPVLRIFGVGFKAPMSFVDDTAGIADLIDWFQNTADDRYRVFLIGGVPSNWRSLSGDSRSGTAWKSIYDSFDGIHPWHVGRYSTDDFESYYTDKIKADAEYCAERDDIIYMPTLWAGFSWHNLKDHAFPVNQIPRLGGRFMWQQAHRYSADSNIHTIWMAQFDEVDEGTAIMKVAQNSSYHPVSGTWLALDADGQALPSDWYLRLAGEAQKMFKGEIALTGTIPITP